MVEIALVHSLNIVLKKLRKPPISKNFFKMRVFKFEENEDFGVLPERRLKQVANETVKDVATASVARASNSSYS